MEMNAGMNVENCKSYTIIKKSDNAYYQFNNKRYDAKGRCINETNGYVSKNDMKKLYEDNVNLMDLSISSYGSYDTTFTIFDDNERIMVITGLLNDTEFDSLIPKQQQVYTYAPDYDINEINEIRLPILSNTSGDYVDSIPNGFMCKYYDKNEIHIIHYHNS